MGGGKSLILFKKTKNRGKNVISYMKLFSKTKLLISTSTWLVDYKNQKNTNGCINQEVKHLLFLGKYRFEVVKVKDCKIKYEDSKTFQKRN